MIATMDFGSRMGLYDFTDNQWHNQLRARRMVTRGERGEIGDNQVIRLLSDTTIVASPPERRQLGYDLDLDGFDTDHVSLGDHILYRNPCSGLRLNDDEIAVCDLLLAMDAWSKGRGPEPYPLAQGCQDHQLGLGIEGALATGGDIRTTSQPWCT